MKEIKKQQCALRLNSIVKDYGTNENVVHALKGVSINFRKNEFVSILGPSGCGKTTLLNIVGGLDHYTQGDLLIGGVSTKKFNDRDWDTYRNHSIGFVFQTYNLIPHQTVLANVELALTLSGVSKQERKERAIVALEKVGLKDQIHKRPNQLSGGQMQRVAIARALVNNPEIILADEPTGALDTETSVQVMEILKEVANDRLVIMVTHNPELAEKYSSRIVRMLDGNVIGDTMPFEVEEQPVIEEKEKKAKKKVKKPTMSFWTAFKLSLNNLFTKKGRTVLTSFAGSIGIIGIALILAVSQGTTGYINHVQESTLSSYPITIETESMDLTSLMKNFIGDGDFSITHDKDAVYKDPIIGEMVNALSSTGVSKNDLKSFKAFLDKELKDENSKLYNAVTGVQYTYDMELTVYTKNVDGKIIKSDTATLMGEMIAKYMKAMVSKGDYSGVSGSGESTSQSPTATFMPGASGLWQELLPGVKDGQLINDLIYDQYELIDGGSWPNDYNEIVLVVNENNELDDLTLYALGLIGQEEIDAIIDAAVNGKTLENNGQKWTYEDLKKMKFKVVLPADRYQNRGDGVYIDASELLMESLYERSIELKVTGIIRHKEDADASMLSSGICYTRLLTEHVIEKAGGSEVVKAQKANPNVDVLTGLPFASVVDAMTVEEKADAFRKHISTLTEKEQADMYINVLCLNAEKANLTNAVAGLKTRFSQDQAFRTYIIDMVLTAYANQLGVDKAVLESYLGEATEEELLVYVTPVFAEMAKQGIRAEIVSQTAGLSDAQKAQALGLTLNVTQNEDIAEYYDELTEFSTNTYEDNLVEFGCLDLDTPFTVNIYTSTFEDKDAISAVIENYNKSVGEEQQIHYNDYVGLLMSSVTQIIDAITYVLIAFVSISLVVSSIMIGVITLISVQERTKEIGILRAIGASKKDVSSMFNAETLIIGFTSGLFGVVITYLLCIPINLILHALTGLSTLSAVLPVPAAIILVAISMCLTLISGIIPSRSAAKKDPVVALRTE